MHREKGVTAPRNKDAVTQDLHHTEKSVLYSAASCVLTLKQEKWLSKVAWFKKFHPPQTLEQLGHCDTNSASKAPKLPLLLCRKSCCSAHVSSVAKRTRAKRWWRIHRGRSELALLQADQETLLCFSIPGAADPPLRQPTWSHGLVWLEVL